MPPAPDADIALSAECVDCHLPFVITVSEQRFFAAHALHTPRRCRRCRALKRAARDALAARQLKGVT